MGGWVGGGGQSDDGLNRLHPPPVLSCPVLSCPVHEEESGGSLSVIASLAQGNRERRKDWLIIGLLLPTALYTSHFGEEDEDEEEDENS